MTFLDEGGKRGGRNFTVEDAEGRRGEEREGVEDLGIEVGYEPEIYPASFSSAVQFL